MIVPDPQLRRLALPPPENRKKAARLFFFDEANVSYCPKTGRVYREQGSEYKVNTPGKNQRKYLIGSLEYPSGDGLYEIYANKTHLQMKTHWQHLMEMYPDEMLFYENTAFEQEISADLSHKIIKSAEQLTYQHFCILSMVGRRENDEDALRDFQPNPQLDPPLKLSKLLHDCFELVTNGYIQGGLTFTFNGRLPQYETLNPNSMLLENIGRALFSLMNLQDIPDDDIVPIAELLHWEKSTLPENGEVSWNPEI